MNLWGEEIDPMPPTPRQLGRQYAAAVEPQEPRAGWLRPIVMAVLATWIGFVGAAAILLGVIQIAICSMGGG